MIVHVYFSLYSSPTEAYGSVSGDLDLEPPFVVGTHVTVLRPKEQDWLSGSLTVESVTHEVNLEKTMIGLEDVIAQSPEDASRLARRFETEAGLFCDIYD